jgi:hypothetical protein
VADTSPQPVELDELVARQQQIAANRRGPDITERPTFVQWAGFWLLWAVLGLIALLLAGLLIYLAVATPDLTAFGSPATPDSVALHARTSEVVFQRVTTLLDQVVIKTLVPVLTLLLGYVFGARAGQPTAPDQGTR